MATRTARDERLMNHLIQSFLVNDILAKQKLVILKIWMKTMVVATTISSNSINKEIFTD